MDDKAPSMANPQLTVSRGNSVRISDDILKVRDADTLVQDLTFSVVDVPEFGDLTIQTGENYAVLRQGKAIMFVNPVDGKHQLTLLIENLLQIQVNAAQD